MSGITDNGYTISPTDILVNCPIVPGGSQLETGKELTQAWYKGQMVFYPDYGPNPDITAPIYVLITGTDGEGNPQFVQGQNNIIDVVPGDEGYSDFWRVNLVTVPQDYVPNTFKSAAGVQASGYPINMTDIVVNCPVVSVDTAMPAVTIGSPSEGATLSPGDSQVSISVSNFNIVDKLGQDTVAGEGHVHYYLDVDPPTTPGQPAVTAPGTYAATTSTSHTWEDVPAGTHTLAVQLVNNNHTPLEPAVTDEVSITVAEPGQTVTVQLSAENIAFDKSTISVPAGADVVVVFNNNESIPHNLAVYETSAASEEVFVGEIITGPRTIEYRFTAPMTPGTYFFRCDVHPANMTGDFIVTST